MDMEETNSLLKEKMLARMTEPGNYTTAIDGLGIYRRNVPNSPENCLYLPLATIVIQGRKQSTIGSEKIIYGQNQCLVAGLDLPSANFVLEASPDNPYLSISLTLDKKLISDLVAEMPESNFQGKKTYKGAAVTDIDADFLGAFLRLFELQDKQEQIPFLAPLIIREIHYKLLTGPLGEHLRATYSPNSYNNQIAKVATWMRSHFKKPLNMDEVAKMFGMSTSSFHRHFKEVTTLSPLQFQKRLRLYEAQRLMLYENETAYNACLEVGYESPSQFNREYKRLFGEPPRRDVIRQMAV